MDNFFLAHIKDLSDRASDKSIFTFTNFLNEEEQNKILSEKKNLNKITVFGGCEGTQRNIIRFGDEDELYYSENFPVVCIKASPLNKKFSDELTHRDCLGALMNLSIEREYIGDIVIKDNIPYFFVIRKMSSFICENLTKIKHTDVRCSECEFDSDSALFKTEAMQLISSSLRADCVVCSVFNLSRSQAEMLFSAKKIFINSVQCENTSKQLKENDTVSVRGYGKFIFDKIISETKKGRLRLNIKIYR